MRNLRTSQILQIPPLQNVRLPTSHIKGGLNEDQTMAPKNNASFLWVNYFL